MTLWLVFALMTAAAVFAVLWPLGRAGHPQQDGSETIKESGFRTLSDIQYLVPSVQFNSYNGGYQHAYDKVPSCIYTVRMKCVPVFPIGVCPEIPGIRAKEPIACIR